MEPAPDEPRPLKLPRMGYAGPYASATPPRRTPARPAASTADRFVPGPSDVGRLRCAAALLALLATVSVQAGYGALAPGLTGGARAGSLAVGLAAVAAALPILRAMRRRSAANPLSDAPPDYVPLGTYRIVPASAAALFAFGLVALLERNGSPGAATAARTGADFLSLGSLYWTFMAILDARRVGRTIGRLGASLLVGGAPSLAPLLWSGVGRLLER